MKWRWLCVVVVAGLLTAHLHAAEPVPWGESLIARDSLAGWDAGPEPPKGWTVKNGVLRGDSESRPLVSAWTFGDFELEYTWQGSNGAFLVVEFLNPRSGDTYRRMRGSFPFGMPTTTGQPAPKSTFRIKRVGGLWEDFDQGWDKPPTGEAGNGDVRTEWDIARLAIRLSIEKGSGEITSVRIKEPAGQPMFNGKDLTGWWTPGNLASWPVIDGHLVCINQKGDYLRSEKEYGNFTLSLDYKMAAGGNSGIGIRTPRLAWPSSEGMELQMLDEPAGGPMTRHSTMSIYGNIGPLARADRSEQWNHVVVKAEGYLITAWMNGELVQHVNTFWKPELKHRFLGGWIGLQDHGARTEFRDIRLLEAPAGLGLDSWYQPRPAHGSEIVVNRLMNLAELSRPDTTAVVPNNADDSAGTGACDNAGGDKAPETALAEIRGPGAVVAITVPSQEARLRFYFDGADKPAVDCSVAELPRHLPMLTADQSPLLVYVPFRESLLITSSDTPVGSKIEYLPFDSQTIVEPFVGPATPVRGLLPALSYRYEQHGHGGLRQVDRLLKQTSETLVAEPGQRVELLKLVGLGIVEWFRLHCPTKALQNDDLWLEITTDGDALPTITAPVRYYFPGLDQAKNYQNFVVLSKNGFTNRLAMPYTQGISFAVTNRGRRAVKDLELTVAHDDSYRVEEGGRSVLRGAFQRSAEPLELSFPIPVRLVGIVSSDSPDQPVGPIRIRGTDDRGLEELASDEEEDVFGLPAGSKDVRQTLNGRSGGLAWRWWLLGPPQVTEVAAEASGSKGGRMVFYYAAPGALPDPAK